MRSSILFISCALLLSSCRAPETPSASGNYQTLSKDPRRDTDAARKDNDAALQLISKDDYAGAEQVLRRALQEDIMFGPAHNSLGLVYYHQSQLYLAAWEFQYAIKLMPNQPEASNNLGLVFEAGGKLDQAIDAYELAIKSEPHNAQFIGNSARARIRRGENGLEVRDLLMKLVEVDTRPEWVSWAKERLIFMKGAVENSGKPTVE